MATLGAELGCERYLALTVVTGSGQRSSTFLAKLRRNRVFVLALRAFHCRPRRKKRARCTARVTSHMIGDKADVLGFDKSCAAVIEVSFRIVGTSNWFEPLERSRRHAAFGIFPEQNRRRDGCMALCVLAAWQAHREHRTLARLARHGRHPPSCA